MQRVRRLCQFFGALAAPNSLPLALCSPTPPPLRALAPGQGGTTRTVGADLWRITIFMVSGSARGEVRREGGVLPALLNALQLAWQRGQAAFRRHAVQRASARKAGSKRADVVEHKLVGPLALHVHVCLHAGVIHGHAGRGPAHGSRGAGDPGRGGAARRLGEGDFLIFSVCFSLNAEAAVHRTDGGKDNPWHLLLHTHSSSSLREGLLLFTCTGSIGITAPCWMRSSTTSAWPFCDACCNAQSSSSCESDVARPHNASAPTDL